MRKRHVIILSHHPLFVYGLKVIINHSKDFTVTEGYGTEYEFLSALGKTLPDIALIDCSGFTCRSDLLFLVNRMADKSPDTKLLMTGDDLGHRIMTASFSLHFPEYVCKSQGAHQVMMALDRVDAGSYRAGDAVCHKAGRGEGAGVLTLEDCLSAKEIQVIRLIRSGLTVSEAAQKINRSIKTVSTQKRSAMKKLGLMNDKDIYSLHF